MVTGSKILVRAQKLGLSKTWFWDAKQPLNIRRPFSLRLHVEGRDVILRGEDGRARKIGVFGESFEVLPSKGAELHLSPVSAIARPTVPPLLRPKTATESLRFGFSFVASAMISALAWMSFGTFSTPSRPAVQPMREMRVQNLPTRVTLPAPVQLEFKKIPVVTQVSGPGAVTGEPGSAAGAVRPVAPVAPGAIANISPGSSAGTGTGTSRGSARAESRARAKVDMIREAFGSFGAAGGTAAAPSQNGSVADTSAPVTKRTRFGFGKAGTPSAGEGDDSGSDSSAPNLGSSAQVVQKITQAYGERTTAVAKAGTISALDPKAVEGSGTAWNTPQAGYNPILLDNENLSVGEGLTHQEVQSVIQKHLHEVRRCHELASRRSTTFQGKVQVKFRILASGSLAEPALAGAEAMEAGLQECLIRRVASWKFSAPRGRRDVEVSYPFVFMTLEGEAP